MVVAGFDTGRAVMVKITEGA
ncbi:hypothetical protein [Citrobacter sp. ANG330]